MDTRLAEANSAPGRMSGRGRQRKFKLRSDVGVTDIHPDHHIRGMNIELDDEQAAALIKELHDIVENDPYPFSPRISTLRAILDEKLRPEPVLEPLPPPKHYAPPRATRATGLNSWRSRNL
jgi:hypothetical protein